MANYRISELDFDDIKFNLKQFLSNYRDNQGNLVFKDYDFEASSLSILLDLLAYNTHYNSYFANMVANEMFLDSAIKRESVVSIAKHLGYTPLSYRSARAKVTFTIQNPAGSPAVLTLPKFTKFSTTINGTTYTFATLDSITTKPVNNQYTFSDVEIVEGEALVYTYRVDKSGPDEKYAIPNTNIDTTTIRVIVQNSYTDLTQTTFTRADSLEGLTGQSNVFFLEENPTGKYEVYFGDGVLGKKLVSGNLVRIEYLKSNGSLCNVSDNISQSFVLEDLVGGVTLDSAIIATQNSTGGDEADSIEEIKFRAPRFLSSFNRAVTANDYKAIIEANYPLVESVSVWGGEENVPPVYGKVYISLKPYSGFAISTELKNRIKTEILAEKKMLAIIPEILDPNYLYIGIDSKLKFDPKNSRYLASEIEILTKAAIEGYFVNELQKFNKSFIYSKLSRAIDAVDSSIVGNVSAIKLQKRIYPTIDASNKYSGTTEIKFVNSLISGTIQSTGFVFNSNDVLTPVYIKDVLTSSSTGTLNLYNLFTDALIKSNLGTVNYTTGTVSIPDLNPAGFYTTENVIKIYGKTNELDIQSSRDVVLVIDDSTLNTTIKQSAGLTVDITLV